MADAIVGGLLADQEQLPSESELADRFGVSTVTVREALTALRQQGLVETRRGRGGGSFVRAPAQQSPATAVLRERLGTMTPADIRDIGDEYTAIAGTAARLAAERASAEDVTRIRAAAEEFGSSEPPALHRAERGFHLEVAAASQSPRLTQMEVRLQGEVGALLWLPASQRGNRRRACEEHSAIVSAIADGDGTQARSLTEDHVLDVVEGLAELHLRLVAP
ncbi:FCD domain-containing protein [Saccharopolyspora rosea]